MRDEAHTLASHGESRLTPVFQRPAVEGIAVEPDVEIVARDGTILRRQPLLLGRLFPRQRDRTHPRLSRLRNGRPVVRGEFDLLMRVSAHRSHNLTDAIESLPSGLQSSTTQEHHDIL